MKIISWNVRGVGSKHKRSLIKSSISRKNPDVVCLQETKVSVFKDHLLTSLWKERAANYLTLDVVGSSGGILMAWNSSKWELISSNAATFSLSIVLKDKSSFFQCLLTVVYGPNNDSLRNAFWEELSLVRASFSRPLCVVDDFNITRFTEDHSRKRRPFPAMRRFSDWIQSEQLIDLPLLGAKFTWSNERANPTFSRLDRSLLSSEWIDSFPSSKQFALPRTTSDHSPLLLCEEDLNWGPKPFKIQLCQASDRGSSSEDH
ncbi:uncharacterized protein LOC131254135 [Magnolia sinica]|uniref:uncharacterized protein LOC131254135 n=1 Tax=Magnolia sinica TaxID=86752 RepID=UPI00265890BB|nr:uncharacterized protein LOC131254135 [Magnolia sinica]